MKSNNFFIGSIVSLVFGTLIYVLFRTSSLKIFSWSNSLGINLLGLNVRKLTMLTSSKLPQWLLFSFPDSLWVFSYVCLMLGIWKGVISPFNLFWVGIIPFIAVCSELGQFIGFIQGTFDLLDIVFYIIGTILPLLLFKQSITYNLKFLQNEKKH
ncbi:hypothetical protein [Chryseobacterium sp. G0201]|uniref:hypothetical protein n=1 Tax=Chryseobacterium sp. G0201 TaxID=2487065 RepID=UPI000F4DC2C4|nr:hypothetical protein [Chryseobacterium sp. G0201]AZA51551.1 hypothetical protein EG348_00295 [Chryseobacterium sp. G0201]